MFTVPWYRVAPSDRGLTATSRGHNQQVHFRDLRVAAALVLTACATALSHADENAIREAIIARIEQKRSFQIPEDSEFVIDTFYGEQPIAAQEIEKLQRLAPADSGAAVDLADALARRAHGGRGYRVRLFHASENAWRLGRESVTGPDQHWTDYAMGRQGAWTLTKRQLQHAGRVASLPDGVPFDPDLERRTLTVVLAGLATGIPWPAKLPVEFGTISLNGDTFRAEIKAENSTFLIKGVYVGGPGSAAIRIDRVEIAAPPESVGAHQEYRDWQPVTGAAFDLARASVSRRADGLVESSLSVKEAGPLARDISLLTARPEQGREDPLRGATMIDSVIEHTPAAQIHRDGVTGDVVARQAHGSSIAPPRFMPIVFLILTLGAVGGCVLRMTRSTR